jgi:hypothetical protein
MHRSLLSAVLSLSVLLSTLVVAQDASYTFTTIDVPFSDATGGDAMTPHPSHDPLDRITQVMHTGITRLMWLWVLGEVWFTLLMAGAVVVLLWAR